MSTLVPSISIHPTPQGHDQSSRTTIAVRGANLSYLVDRNLSRNPRVAVGTDGRIGHCRKPPGSSGEKCQMRSHPRYVHLRPPASEASINPPKPIPLRPF